MMITRTYKTKEECAKLMVREMFTYIPDYIIYANEEWYQIYGFEGKRYQEDFLFEEVEDEGEYGMVGEPACGTWFMIEDTYMNDWVYDHQNEVMDIGFTIIYENGELFALGIDGGGYDFYEAHWIPLYEAINFQWHD